MTGAQSTIDSLKELNFRLIAEIGKLRNENAEIARLRKGIPELRKEKDSLIIKNAKLLAKFAELEQSAKKNAENAKLGDAELYVRIIELERSSKETKSLKTEFKIGKKAITK